MWFRMMLNLSFLTLLMLKWEKRKIALSAHKPTSQVRYTMALWSAKGMGVMSGWVTDEKCGEERLESVVWNDWCMCRVFVCDQMGLMCSLGRKVWIPSGRSWTMDCHISQKTEKKRRGWKEEAGQGWWSDFLYTRSQWPQWWRGWRKWRGDTGKSRIAYQCCLHAQPPLQTQSPVAIWPALEPKHEDEIDPDDPNLTWLTLQHHARGASQNAVHAFIRLGFWHWVLLSYVDMDAKVGVETEGAEAGKQVCHKPCSLKNLGSPVPH